MKLNKSWTYYLIRKLFGMKLIKVIDYHSNDPIYLDPSDVSTLTMVYDFNGGVNYTYTISHHSGPGYGGAGGGGYIQGPVSNIPSSKTNARVSMQLKNGTNFQIKEHIEIVAALVEGRDPGPATVLYGEASGNESKQDTPT